MADQGPLLPHSSMLTFHGLASSGLFHGVFNRHGGVSPEPWNTLNVSRGLGDSLANVIANRTKIKNALGCSALVSARQVHGSAVYALTQKPADDFETDGFDALLTNVRGAGLMIQQADCQAVMFFDPVKMAVGIAHVGWRGSVADIIGKTVSAMTQTFGSEPSGLVAAISPSLGPCCAEFINYRSELPEPFHKYQVRPNYFDFWAISSDQLRAAGVRRDNIHNAKICTCCNSDYFSYRRARETGRFASVIGLRLG